MHTEYYRESRFNFMRIISHLYESITHSETHNQILLLLLSQFDSRLGLGMFLFTTASRTARFWGPPSVLANG
jgi:hypothetical protein